MCDAGTLAGVNNWNEASVQCFDFAVEELASSGVLNMDGMSLQSFLGHASEIIEVAAMKPAATVRRCSPTQNAAAVLLLQTVSKKRVIGIGDRRKDVIPILACACWVNPRPNKHLLGLDSQEMTGCKCHLQLI